MPQRIIDHRNIRPGEAMPGDVFVCVVKLHITHFDDRYRVYQCTYPPQVSTDGIPQGGRLLPTQAEAIAEALFPIAITDLKAE